MMPRSAEQLALYFREAAVLRSCLAFNRNDFEFARSGGRIIYLMDANIVRFFASPERETKHILPFRSSEKPDYAEATALITAEFLFSRSLAGQQRGPAYIAASHGEELGEIISAIRGDTFKANAAGDPLETLDEKHAELRHLLERLDSGAINRQEAASRLVQIVPDLAKLLLDTRFQDAAQLARLYEEDLLRPLALHSNATKEILFPDSQLVAKWKKRIHDKRPTLKDKTKVDRDAEVLVQTMLLDEAAQANTDGVATRYVLVTADQKLFDAYVDWFWSKHREPHQRFVLRMPLQYAPILNMFEMPNGIEDSLLTERASQALDSLFARLQKADAEFVERLLWYRLWAKPGYASSEPLEQFFGQNPLIFDDATVEEFIPIRELWHKCFRTGVVLNTRLMNRRKAEFDFLAYVLGSNGDLRKEIYDKQERNLERIEAAHTAFSARVNLADLVNDDNHGKFGSEARRAELLVRAQFPDSLGKRSLTTALADIRKDQSLLRVIEAALRKGDSQAFFLAGCIAYTCGQWKAAASHAARTLELMEQEAGPDDVAGEVAFLQASALRYALAFGPIENEDRIIELTPTVKVLHNAVESCTLRNDPYGISRALAELNSLMLMKLYYRWLAGLAVPDDELLELENYRQRTETAIQMLQESRAVLDDPESIGFHSPLILTSDMIDQLADRIACNCISAGVYARVLASDTSASSHINPSTEYLAAAVAGSGQRNPRDPAFHIMSGEAAMAQLALGSLSSEAVLTKLDALLQGAQHDHNVLHMDMEELKKFKLLVEQAHTGEREPISA